MTAIDSRGLCWEFINLIIKSYRFKKCLRKSEKEKKEDEEKEMSVSATVFARGLKTGEQKFLYEWILYFFYQVN